MGGPGSGRRRAPAKARQLKGKERRDRRVDPPVPAVGDISCPANLSEGAREVWERLAPDLERKQVLTPWSVDTFAILCEAIDQCDEAWQHVVDEGAVTEQAVFNRNGERTGERITKNPWWLVWTDASAVALKFAGRFGLTPADLAGLKVGDGNQGGQPGEDLLSA